MAGKRAKDPSLLQTDFSTARQNSAKLITDWEGLTEARTLLVASVGNTYTQGSLSGAPGSWVDQITTSHDYIRISTDGGSNWIELPIADLATLTADSHPALTIGIANGLTIDGANQILSLATATTTTPGVMSPEDKTLLDKIASDGPGENVLTDDGIYKILIGDPYIDITHDNINNEIEFTFNPSQLSITTTEGVQGGSNLSTPPTLKLDINGLTALETPVPTTDYVAVYDADTGLHKKVLLKDIGAIYTATSLGNSGDGSVVLSGTVNNNFQFKRIKAGTNVTITEAANSIQVDFSGTGTGENNTASNAGLSGVGLVLTKNGIDLPFKAIDAGSNKISVTDDGTNKTVDIDVVPANILHDNLGSVDPNDHIDHTTVSIIAGTALSGGGTIDANRTINIDYTEPDAATVVVDSDLILIYDGSAHKTAPVSLLPYVTSSRTITTTEGIQGGGNLSANRTFKLDINGLVAQTGIDAAADYLVMYDASAAVHKKILLQDLPTTAGTTWGSITGTLSNQTDLQNALNAKVPTSTTITAGTGLSGGGALSSNLTIDLNIFELTTSTPSGTDFVAITNATGSSHTKALLSTLPYPVTSVAGKTGAVTLALIDLTDVNSSTPTNRNFLVADGIDWESRPIENNDIPTALTGKTYNGVSLTTGGVNTSFLNATGQYSTIDASVWVSDTNGIHYSTGVRQGNIGVGLDSRSDSSIFSSRNATGWAGYFYNEGSAVGANGILSYVFSATNYGLETNGLVKFSSYGSGKAGTATYALAVDATGKVITTDLAGGSYTPPVNTKGDIFTYSTIPTKLPVGTNGQVLVSDSAEVTGLKWINNPSAIWTDGGSYAYLTGYEDIYMPYTKAISWRNSSINVSGANLMKIVGGSSSISFRAGASEVEVMNLYGDGTLGLGSLSVRGAIGANLGSGITYESDSYNIGLYQSNNTDKLRISGLGAIIQKTRPTHPTVPLAGYAIWTAGSDGNPYYTNESGVTYNLAAGIASISSGNGMNFTTISGNGAVGTITLGNVDTVTTTSQDAVTTGGHSHALNLSGRIVNTQYSLTGGGNLGVNLTLNLVNDVAIPAASNYYGTNESGTRGWHLLPTGGGGTVTYPSAGKVAISNATATGWEPGVKDNPIGAFVGTTDTQIISNKTLTLPKINDTSLTHQYIFGVNELVASRTITLPLLIGNDTFVFEGHTQTLTNKTLTTPIITSMYQDAGKTKLFSLPNSASDTLVSLAATQILTNKTISGSSNSITNIDGANIDRGTINPNRLGSNLNSTYFLKGDSTWQAVSLPNHTHGNISSDGKIGLTPNLVVVTTTGGLLTTLPAAASNYYLSGTGSYVQLPSGLGSVTSVYAGYGITTSVAAGGANTGGFTDTGYINLRIPANVGPATINDPGTLAVGHTHQLDTITVNKGGTGGTTFSKGAIIVGNNSTTLSSIAATTIGNVLISNGVNTDPLWAKVTPQHIYAGSNGQVLTSTFGTVNWAHFVEDIAFEFADVTGTINQTYILDISASFNYTITGFVVQSGLTSLPYLLKVSTTTILDSAATQSVVVTSSMTNSVATGQQVSLVLDTATSATFIRGKIRYTRA